MITWIKSFFGARDPEQFELEAAVMPLSGRVVVMSATGNEVIMPSKALAITEAVLLHRQVVEQCGAQPAPIVCGRMQGTL